MNGVMKCWPCQNAKIAGCCGSTRSYTSAGSIVNLFVRQTSRRYSDIGATNGTDAEALGGDRVEFAVAMPRYQHFGPMTFLGLDERRHEMLAVPERKDRGLLRFDTFIHVSRVDREFVRAPDQPEVLGYRSHEWYRCRGARRRSR